MTGKLERDAIADWAAATGADRKNISQSLAALPVGQAHVFSPQWLGISTTTKIAKKQSPDVSATPKVGDRKEAPKALSPVDLQDLRVSMEAAIERAKQADTKELCTRISALEAELSAARASKPETVPIEVPVLTDQDRAAVSALVKKCDALAELGDQLRAALAKASTTPAAAHAATSRKPSPGAPRMQSLPVRPASSRTAEKRGNKLAGGERKILIALAQYPGGRTKKQVAILAGYAHGGGAYNNYLSALRTQLFIEGRDALAITAAGLEGTPRSTWLLRATAYWPSAARALDAPAWQGRACDSNRSLRCLSEGLHKGRARCCKRLRARRWRLQQCAIQTANPRAPTRSRRNDRSIRTLLRAHQEG